MPLHPAKLSLATPLGRGWGGLLPSGRAWVGLFIFLLLFPLSSSAQYQVDFAVSRADFADTIAIEWSQEQVYVPVTIDGRRYRFLLDTGAGQSVVFAGTPLAASRQDGTIISHDATGRTDTVPVVVLPPLQLGSLTLTGCRATLQPGPSSLDGILGFDLVNGGLSMTIDVPHRRLVLTDRRVRRTAADVVLRYRLHYHVPYVDIVPFGRHRERVLVDTGSRQFFVMNRDHLLEAIDDETATPAGGFIDEGRAWGSHAIGHYGAEPAGEVAFFRLDALHLGDCTFTALHGLTTAGGSHLGAPLLQYGAVTFDARRHRLLFCPADGLPAPFRVDNRQLEMAFVANGQGLPQVGLVWPGGEPCRLGFRQGDVVEQIDHRPVRSMSQFVRWGFERGRSYLFTLRSADGSRHEVEWVRIP